ncbi:MAG: NTP transferase domain-containing protein [Actinomycetales bacterium]|nr:NTP transferase domain-containing protein [Actinomycetales bacterium]
MTVPAPGRPGRSGPARPADVPGPSDDEGWAVVLPVKGGDGAKSRLAAGAGAALDIALDCLDAVLGCPEVDRAVVVTAHPPTARAVGLAGAPVVPESRPGAGLVAAVRDGLAALAGSPGPCAVLLADLPALRPGDLGAALRAAQAALRRTGGPAAVFVPDAEGTGTVLLAAGSAAAIRPAFGPGSAAAHALAGAARLDLDLPRLRRDVDTAGDLRTAAVLGLGRRTAARFRTGDAARHRSGDGARRPGG